LAWSAEAPAQTPDNDPYASARASMVARIAAPTAEHPVTDSRVLDALRQVPRHLFVPKSLAPKAYSEEQLSIGKGQTISEPAIVAYMTQTLEPRPADKVLEVGTGSGYQAAVLSRLAKEVYTIEIVPALAKQAQSTLQGLGYDNVWVKAGDGYRGWPEKAPFDAIIVTCAPDHIPAGLVDQLQLNGRLLIPVGVDKGGKWKTQALVVVRKTDKGMVEEKRLNVHFGPMKGEATKRKSSR
jgi:protein-L-isoaspartate(D-aspartate) O-methyltransferase